MTWLLLAVTIGAEVAATSFLRAAGTGDVVAILGCVAGYATAFGILAYLVQRLEVSLIYALWSGVGTALVAGIGIALLGESASPPKLFGLGLIVIGVVLVNLAPTT
ncbi:DMT family transporter [Patulibacter defluvii]|uniref:DMT family transporter n=1 Tax=Patulibacter defluvii TaxID=3095358 RepID=UPI002A74E999|nr:SMR family transporter [Patulibacter sp. DM4]